MCKQNLGKLDRVLRFVLAVWWLGPLAPNYPYVWVNWAVFIIGWIALIESFIGYCKLHEWLGVNNKNQ
ncbi:hypothetical protein COV18_00740 [Candidatus Woesearchaeota archaeon CG10_big_fil_rev_8_21_14_0_10_37_12]|nr:MAG: hypothetical protein COV18_00740 [Candidatus Woesearchaeota archaeon CG10_big_fil_rev_8_21_14_0_10_37_12]